MRRNPGMNNKKLSLFGKKLAKTVSTVLVLAMLVGTTVSAKTTTPKDVFDANYYSQTYSDLNAAFGKDAKALYNHYVKFGQKEQRVFTELINLKKYREAYADLNAAFGDNWNAYLNHYVTFGIKEGRNSFGTFDARAYADRYPDLKKAFGYDVMALYRHWLAFGSKEGRNCHADVVVASSNDSDDNNCSNDNSGSNSGSNSGISGGTSTAEVVARGTLVDPEGNAIPNAVVRFTRTGDLYEALASVSGNDVSGNDVSGNNAGSSTVTTGNGWYEVTTDANGNYVIAELPAGRYEVTASAPGYMTLTMTNFAVASGSGSFEMPTFNLLSENYSGENYVAGIAKDAVTGQTLAGVTLKVRANWNNKEGEVLNTFTTGADGSYNVTLERGYYTIEFAREGYASVFVNVFSSNASRSFDGTLNPTATAVDNTQFRVVLTWGETPRDLDSHLVGPTVAGDSADYFHVYFAHKVYYDLEHEVNASLDVDDTSSYGPETVTVFNVQSDKPYYYSVHDFTNSGNSNSTEMSFSGANVKVYQGATLIKEYNVPSNQAGNVWNVFYVKNNQIHDQNVISSDYNAMLGDYNGVEY